MIEQTAYQSCWQESKIFPYSHIPILSYDRWYVPAKASFSKPIGLFLTISHLKKFHGPVHYQDNWHVVGWSKCILFSLFLVYRTANNVGFPQQDVWVARIRSFSQTFSLDKWWFWRCQLISPSQLFRAIHSVNPRLLPHVPLVIAEKEDAVDVRILQFA